MQTSPTRRPVWPWILGGCLFLIGAAIAIVIILWKVGTDRLAKNVEENLRNPALREEKAKRLLHAQKLPAGYYPVSGTFEFPLITHVRLSDRAPDSYGSVLGYDKTGFVYTDSLHTSTSKAIEGFFNGTSGAETFENMGIRVRAKETLGKGNVAAGKQRIRYRTVRGRFEEGEHEVEGLLTLMLVDCPDEKRERWAIWFGPEGSNVGDETAIGAFMGHFDLCVPR